MSREDWGDDEWAEPIPDERSYDDTDAILSQPEAGPKLDAPAKVGGGSFSVGVAWETVIKAAQRSYEYELRKKKLTPEEKITEEMNRRELFDMLHNRDQSKKVYGVLATAYRPDQQADQFTVDYPTQGILREVNQHEASMAAVQRHKGATPPASDHPYHCHLHGWWSAVKESGCPSCVVEARKSIAELTRHRDELRAENERLRKACVEMNGALSQCAYHSGEPNEQRCSWYDVEPYPQSAVDAVRKMREELVELRSKLNKGE